MGVVLSPVLTRSCVILAVLAAPLALPAAAPAAISTVVTTANPIRAFAYDGSWIGWDAWPDGRCGATGSNTAFGVQSLETARRLIVPDKGLCVRHMAVGGSQVIWNAPRNAFASSTWTTPYAEIFPQPMRDFDTHVPGSAPGGMASDGDTLVETWRQLSSSPSGTVISGGGLERISGYTRTAIPGTGPAAAVQALAGRVAFLPIQVGSLRSHPQTKPIEVRNVMNGALSSTIAPPGTFLSMAFGGGRLAVLLRLDSGQRQIRVYNPDTGALVVTHDVASDVAATIDMSVAGVLFRRGAELRLASLTAARQRSVAMLAHAPAAMGLEGTTIVFAINNSAGQGFVRRLPAPPV
jgi:hypothetical protein